MGFPAAWAPRLLSPSRKSSPPGVAAVIAGFREAPQQEVDTLAPEEHGAIPHGPKYNLRMSVKVTGH